MSRLEWRKPVETMVGARVKLKVGGETECLADVAAVSCVYKQKTADELGRRQVGSKIVIKENC